MTNCYLPINCNFSLTYKNLLLLTFILIHACYSQSNNIQTSKIVAADGISLNQNQPFINIDLKDMVNMLPLIDPYCKKI